jgi:hypothetical protein
MNDRVVAWKGIDPARLGAESGQRWSKVAPHLAGFRR